MRKLYVYILRSRNKDNKDVPNFRERIRTILEYEDNEDMIYEKFKVFAAEGVHGEKTRLYRTVNARNEEKIREDLIIKLIKDKPSMTAINRTLASVAQQAANRDESKWLFDFDSKSVVALDNFILDLVNAYGDDNSYKVHETPNGYAIIVDHGFDTRFLMDKWKDFDVDLKRDELLFLSIIEKEY